MNWTEFWQRLREPLTQIPYLGESGPWVFLVAVVLLCEFVSDRFLEPRLRARGKVAAADLVAKDLNGLRAGVIVLAFSSATTMEKEAAILGAFVGAAMPLLKNARRVITYVRDELFLGPLAIALAFFLGGCAGDQRRPANMDELAASLPPELGACLLKTEADYRLREAVCGQNRRDTCSTDWLIDKQKEEIKSCFSNYSKR